MPSSVIAAKRVQDHCTLLDKVTLFPVLTYAQIISIIRDDACLKVMLGPVEIVTL